MIYYDRCEFNPPLEELLIIYPDARKKLFYNLIENYKIYLPGIKMIYASLNFNSELRIDYIAIFTGVLNNGYKFLFWDSPYAFTNRSIPGYRYAIKTNQYQEFFNECKKHICQIPYSKFVEFIQSDLCGNLSMDPNSSNFWKNPENSEVLIKNITELGLLYRPKGFRDRKTLKKLS